MVQVFLNIILSYLLGSISGCIFLGKFQGIDIRNLGSGNAGGTNALRSVGPLFALGVIIIDILKGSIAVLYFYNFNFIEPIILSREFLQTLCGAAAILGHVYPIYYNFKGGKGAGTLIGIVGVLFPQCIIYALTSWVLILILTGFVGLSTIIASIVLTCSAYYLNIDEVYFYFALLMSLFIIFTHRSNIIRMFNGKENQFKKIMIFKK